MSACRWIRGLLLIGLPCAPLVAQDSTAAIRGTVLDRVNRGPLVGAKVVASRAAGPDRVAAPHDFFATTDSSGHFAITSLPAAVYLVTVEHPWLDSTGFEVAPSTVDLRDGRPHTLSLAVASGSAIRSAFCPAGARDSTTGVVEGQVLDARSDRPVAGARVLFVWSDFTVDLRTGRATPVHQAVAANTAGDGSFVVCGIPRSQAFLMQAQIGERSATGAIEDVIPRAGVLVRTLRIATTRAGMATVSGEVRRAGTQLPVAGAHVHVFGVDGDVSTAADGTFRLDDVPIGTQSIEVTALGLRPGRHALDVRPDAANRVNIALSGTAQELDTVKAIAKAVEAPALRDEFDQRVHRGTGQYITEDMIARMHPWKTTDLVRYLRGYEYRADTVFSTRGEYALGIGGTNCTPLLGGSSTCKPVHHGGGTCKPVLFIDGSGADSMNEVLPSAIHGIEVYAGDSSVPLTFSSTAITSGCGMILIWTKGPPGPD